MHAFGAELAARPSQLSVGLVDVVSLDQSRQATCAAFLLDFSDEDLLLRFGRPMSREHPAIKSYLLGPRQGCSIIGAVAPGGQLLGTACLSAPGTEGTSEVALAVRRSARLRGVGGALLREAISLAQARGAAAVEASALCWNAPALALLEGAGFQPRGRGPGQVLLRLDLRPR